MLKDIKKFKTFYSNEEGFTLIELMIVVVIIGILAAIAIPIFANQQKAAIVASMKNDVKNTNLNVVTYLNKNPTATVNNLTASKTGTDGTITGPGSGNFHITVSDPETTVRVGNGGGGKTGDWKDYAVWATNPQLGSALDFQIYMYADTGKILQKG